MLIRLVAYDIIPCMPEASKQEAEPTLEKPASWPDVVAWGLFGLVVLFFLILKSFGLHWQSGDENVYFYMAWATADHGALPYGDYFFAHPPLHLLPGILLFGLFGFGPVCARLIPVGATLTGAVFLFLLARRHLGRTAAVASVFFYLTTFSLLRASTHWTGINLSVMWMVIGLWAFFNRRIVFSGICMALGVCTGAYVLPAAMMLGMLALLRSRREALRYLLAFGGLWFVVQLVCLLVGGDTYIDAVYRYHVAKPASKGMAWRMSVRVFTENFALFLGTLLGPVLAAMDRWLQPGARSVEPNEKGTKAKKPAKKKKPRQEKEENEFLKVWLWLRSRLLEDGPRGIARIGALWALGYLLFIAMLARVFPFYFLLLFAPMALAAGYSLERLAFHSVRLVRRAAKRSRSWWKSTGVVGGILVALVVATLVRVPVQRELLPKYVRKADKPMKWSDAPLPQFVNDLLRWCCFEDRARAWVDYGTVTELLFHESRFFEEAEELAEYVKKNTAESQTIFGDSSATGIVALLAGRRMAADFADTNGMRFASGITPVAEAIKKIDTPELALVLVSTSYRRNPDGSTVMVYKRFARLEKFRRWLDANFEPVFRVRDRTKGWFVLLGRKAGGGSQSST